jgi:hypothetical protein
MSVAAAIHGYARSVLARELVFSTLRPLFTAAVSSSRYQNDSRDVPTARGQEEEEKRGKRERTDGKNQSILIINCDILQISLKV